jgi:tetratricopeptide (TPR) repeat protein
MFYRLTILLSFIGLVVVVSLAQVNSSQSSPRPDQMTAQELEARAEAFRSQKDFLSAIQYFNYAIAKAPKNAVLQNKAGMAELQLGRYDEAKRRFEKSVKLKNDYAEAVNNIGVVYYQKRNFKKAIAQYKKALAIRESASFYSNLGAAYFDQKHLDLAMEQYLRALQLDPNVLERSSVTGVSAHVSKPEDRANYAFMLAKLYAKAGDTEHCLGQLRRALENGFPNLKEAVEKDEVFAMIRQDPKFSELMQANVEGIPQM